VQPSFGVTVFVYVCCLFGVDELLVSHSVHLLCVLPKSPPQTSPLTHADDQQSTA
jgi:hypothetical protein